MTIFCIIYLLFNNSKYKSRLGYDERFPIKEDKNKIIELYEKKKLLDILKSDNFGTLSKIKQINEFYGNKNIPQKMNLLNGGLLKDWDFDI
jgi:hypothetical protein